jgi:hypothetical protein
MLQTFWCNNIIIVKQPKSSLPTTLHTSHNNSPKRPQRSPMPPMYNKNCKIAHAGQGLVSSRSTSTSLWIVRCFYVVHSCGEKDNHSASMQFIPQRYMPSMPSMHLDALGWVLCTTVETCGAVWSVWSVWCVEVVVGVTPRFVHVVIVLHHGGNKL